MSYNAGESVIDYSYCEADILKSAKSNIRAFIEWIIGIILAIVLVSALGSLILGSLSCFGSCFGCEACVGTAETADGCMDSYDCYDDGCWERKAREPP